MESGNVVVSSGNGVVMKLPIGFRFRPTDEELVVHYLKRKAYSTPLPASVIPDLDDVSQINPWDLPGDWKEKRYFFSKCKSKSSSISGSGGNGYWKVIGKEKQIVDSKSRGVVVGLKRRLVFYHVNQPIPANWVMHQYRLLPSHSTSTPNPTSSQGVGMKMEEDWVVCCVYEKKRKLGKKVKVIKKMIPHSQASSSLSTCSSGITDVVSSNGSHHHHSEEEEATSSYLPFFPHH